MNAVQDRPQTNPQDEDKHRHEKIPANNFSRQLARDRKKQPMQLSTFISNKAIPTLYEKHPQLGYEKTHNFDNSTVYGREANGRKRVAQLHNNRREIGKNTNNPAYFYPYALTISILCELSVADHKKVWSALTKEMKRLKMSAAWEREIKLNNWLDYHLVVRSIAPNLAANRGRKLRALLHAAAKANGLKFTVKLKAIPSQKDCQKWMNYISKIKIADIKEANTDDVDALANHRKSQDIYASRRCYMRKKTGLHRFGDFGNFWEPGCSPTDQTKNYRAEKKKKEAKRQANPEIREAAEQLAELNKQPVDKIERNLWKEFDGETDPTKRAEIETHNKALAVEYHGSPEDYEEYLRDEKQKRDILQQRRNLFASNRRKPQPKQKSKLPSFDPNNRSPEDSFTVGGTT